MATPRVNTVTIYVGDDGNLHYDWNDGVITHQDVRLVRVSPIDFIEWQADGQSLVKFTVSFKTGTPTSTTDYYSDATVSTVIDRIKKKAGSKRYSYSVAARLPDGSTLTDDPDVIIDPLGPIKKSKRK